MNKNKIFQLFLIVLVFDFSACAKTKASSSTRQPAASEQVQPVVNPELEKLNRVLLSMSDRCKAAIPNGNPEEFLADLHKVLDVDKLYYY